MTWLFVFKPVNINVHEDMDICYYGILRMVFWKGMEMSMINIIITLDTVMEMMMLRYLILSTEA